MRSSLCMHLAGIKLKKVMSVDDQIPCTTSGKSRWQLNDGSIGVYIPLFSEGQKVDRFKAIILLPVQNLTVYQVGVVTSPQVECEDPMMVVMNEAGYNEKRMRPKHQCGRVPKYDAFRDSAPQAKTCAFQCSNGGQNVLEVMVTVQFNWAPWIQTDGLKIYELEAYTYWNHKNTSILYGLFSVFRVLHSLTTCPNFFRLKRQLW